MANLLFALQLSMIAVFTAALTGLAVRLARPLMQALALFWGIRFAYSLLALGLLWTGIRTTWVAFLGASLISALIATIIPVGGTVVQCATHPPERCGRVRWWPFALAGAVLGFAAHLVNVTRFEASEVITIAWMRSLLLFAHGVVLVRVLRSLRVTSARHRLAPLAVGLTAQIIGFVLEAYFRLREVTADAVAPAGATAVTIVLAGTLIFGVCSLLTAIESERDAIAADAERLRVAAQQTAETERLQSLGRLASGVAHDFNNVLSVIVAGVDLAASELDPAKAPLHRELDEVRSAAQRGAALTRRLLAFARRRPERPTRFAPADAARELLPLMERLMTGGVRLDAVIRGEGQVEMDAVRFEQMLVNLVINARDAMPEGGRVRLILEDVATTAPGVRRLGALGSGPYVRLQVEDEGSGIPETLLPVIFEEFVSTKGANGTGLGLATVAAAIREVGGAIDVTTAPGHTAFSLWLPMASTPRPT